MKIISHLYSVTSGLCWPVLTGLLAALLFACGGEDTKPETVTSSPGRISSQAPARPRAQITPLIHEEIGSATVNVSAGTATVAVDKPQRKGQFLFQQGAVKLEFGKGQLPEDFPSEIPIPEGAVIQSVLHGMGIPTQVLLSVDKEYETFQAEYTSKLAANGWEVAHNAPISKGKGIIFECTRGEQKLKATLKAAGASCLLTLEIPQ